MSNTTILYDLANIRSTCFSPNTWRTRIILNYKQIPYTTQWVEYPDLKPTLKSLGVSPNPSGSFADYTSPAIRYSDGLFGMGSYAIANKLDKLYPQRPLYLAIDRDSRLELLVEKLMVNLAPNFLYHYSRVLLRPRTQNWFEEDRKKRVGLELAEFNQKFGGDQAHKIAQETLLAIKEQLFAGKLDNGPFFLGSQVSYNDLLLVACFEGFRRMHPPDFEMIMQLDNAFQLLYDACSEWLERDD